MDAKPQRPVRTLRVKADENVPPVLPGQPVIHQRNKSSPALSTMLGAAGLKAPAKRTAFGDVSNTTNGTRTAKDDGAIAVKQATHLSEKVLPALFDKKPNFLKQVSRPYSVANLRGLLTGAAPPAGVDNASKILQADSNAQANSRKTIMKRPATTIFKDVTLPALQEVASRSSTESEAPPARLPPIHPSCAAGVPSTSNSANTSKPTSFLASDTSLDDPEKSSIQRGTASSESEGSSVLRSDGIYLDKRGDVQIHHEAQPGPESSRRNADADTETSQVDRPGPEPQSNPPAKVLPAPSTVHVEIPQQGEPLPCPEPEEYWEDEEEEENADDEGYMTARSFRSRGENSTGAATTVLFPQVNQRIKNEIEAAKLIVEAEKTPQDIEEESLDTSMVVEYGEEIFDYMMDLEVKMLPNPHYMDNQAEIKWSMRTVLMDWVIQVHHRFNLLPETLFLTVNYIDRFLSCKIVSLGKLQLVGATAIFIAAKYEEINCPSVQEIVYMVDGGYTIDEILKAERFMLTMLQFELGWPGPMSFLRRISKADDYDLETRTLAKYFLEVTIMDEQFIGSPPSFIAAAAHCLARLMLRKGRWTPRHVHYSNYTYAQLLRLLPRIVECCEQPRKHHAQVFQKYADKRYKRASDFVEGEMVRGFMLPSSTKDAAVSYVPPYFDPSAWRHL